jgi:hypothetical protein
VSNIKFHSFSAGKRVNICGQADKRDEAPGDFVKAVEDTSYKIFKYRFVICLRVMFRHPPTDNEDAITELNARTAVGTSSGS